MPIFFWTDIENSTLLWQKHGEAMVRALALHDASLQEAIQAHGGTVVKHTGDGFFAVFNGGQPLLCAIQTQNALMHQDWGEIGEIRVRMALHYGEARERDGDYFGPEVNRTARILSAAWGGQIVVSSDTLDVLDKPPDTTFEDLGVHLLKDLERPQSLWMVHHPALPIQQFPPLRSLSARPNNLPPQPTPFVGRAADVQAIQNALQDPACRLLTLVGPGGAGKSRLALQSAANLIDHFPDGVYFVPLAPLESHAWVLGAIAHALHFTFYADHDQEQQLLHYLEDKRLLFVLDNFEHVLAAAPLAGKLLLGAPYCKILATSRESLHLQGEQVFQISGLPVSDQDNLDALLLFEQSARQVVPDFNLQRQDQETIRTICHLVDGLPLGIKLAASWVHVLSCAQILAELQNSLDIADRPQPDVAKRHHNLRQVFEYSWRLLNPEEQIALQALSAFPGSFTLEAVRDGVGLPIKLLASLVEKSLVQKMPHERYFMLNTIRSYAIEKGGIARATRERLQHYYAEWARAQADTLQSGNQQEALRLVGEEIHNLRAVWGWALDERHLEDIENLAVCLYHFDTIKAWHEEGNATFRTAINVIQQNRPPTHELDETRRRILARALAYRAAFEIHIGNLQEAEIRLKKSLQLSRSIENAELMGFALDKLGRLEDAQGNYQNAVGYYSQALQQYEPIQNEAGIAMALNHIGYAHYRMAQFDIAQEYFTRARQHYQRLQNEWGIATSLNNLGNIAYMLGDYFTAQQHYATSRGLRKALGDQYGYATTCTNLGLLMRAQGDFEQAQQSLQEAASVFAAIGDRRGMGRTWMMQGIIARAQHNLPHARRLLERSISIFERQGDHNNASFARLEVAELDLTEGQVDMAHMRMNQALTFFQRSRNHYGEGLALAKLGHLYLEKNHREQARHTLLQALDLAEETQAASLIHEAVINAARWLSATNDTERAVAVLQAWHQFTQHMPESELQRKQVLREILARRQITTAGSNLPTMPFPNSTTAQITLLRDLLKEKSD